MTAYTERLAWRATDDYVRFWKLSFCRQRDLLTIAFEIPPIGFAGVSVLFVSERIKSLRFETQRQATATGK